MKRCLPSGKNATKFLKATAFRAGFVTSAANGGASVKAIMRQTGHRSLETVMRYMRESIPVREGTRSAQRDSEANPNQFVQ